MATDTPYGHQGSRGRYREHNSSMADLPDKLMRGARKTPPDAEEDKELENLFRHWKKQPKVNAKSVSFAQLDQENNCHRCGKKVYPVEKLDVGVIYHKSCFKCRVCGRQLTFQNFQREIDLDNSQIKEVYCNSHVPRQEFGNLTHDALAIKSAIDAQKRASKKHHRHVYPDHGYVPDFPHRGSGDWSSPTPDGSSESGSRPPSGHWDEAEPDPSSTNASLLPVITGSVQKDIGSTHAEFLPIEPESCTSRPTGGETSATTGVPIVSVSPRQDVPTAQGAVVVGEATEAEIESPRKVLLRRQESASQRNSTIRRRSTLRSFQDFEKHGVFDAQSALEQAQRQEEDELYSQIEAERRALRQRLDDCLRKERDQSVRDLVAFFEKNAAIPKNERQDALVKVEEYYRRRREAALRELLQRLAGEEQAAVARMVEKHSNEMIQLIRKKERIALSNQTTSKKSVESWQEPEVLHTTAPTKSGGNSSSTPINSTRSSHRPGHTAIDTYRSSPVRILPITPIKTDNRHEVMSVSAADDVPAPPLPVRDKKSANSSQRTPTSPSPLPSAAATATPSAFSAPSKTAGRNQRVLHITPIHRRSPVHLTEDDESDVSPVREADISELSIQESEGFEQLSFCKDNLVGVDDNESMMELSDDVYPEAEPPMCPKDKLYSDPEVFKEQDRRAIEESKKDHKTFTDLVRQLSKRCQTELQKVRAIFRWVTVKDLNRMTFDERLDPNSPLGLLRGIKMGTESYHDLFRRLCGYAGLHCEVIEGYSKGAGYRAGDAIQGPTFRNQWTAVWVDGSWRFINCKWGARHVKATRDTSLTYKCDEFYFVTDPEDHIYQHFPDDPVWQLLPEPVSLADFMQLPVLKSPFFNHKLRLARPYRAVLEAQDGQIEIRLQSSALFGIAAKLKSTNRDIPLEILSDRTLVRYVIMTSESGRVGGEYVIAVNLPSPGTYYLDVFAASEWDSGRMDNACAFQVRCTGISRHADVTYPPIGCFGPTPTFAECGLDTDNLPDPYVTCARGGTATVVGFKLTKNISLKSTLRRWDARDQSMSDYDRYVLYRARSSHAALFELQFPRRGLYVYSTYVVNPEDATANSVCLYRYLMDCRAPHVDAQPYPKASKRFRHCRVVAPLSGDLAPDTEVSFVFESKRAVDMMIVISNKSHGLKCSGGKVWKKDVFINVASGKVVLYARFDANLDKYIPMMEYQISRVTSKKYPSLM